MLKIFILIDFEFIFLAFLTNMPNSGKLRYYILNNFYNSLRKIIYILTNKCGEEINVISVLCFPLAILYLMSKDIN